MGYCRTLIIYDFSEFHYFVDFSFLNFKLHVLNFTTMDYCVSPNVCCTHGVVQYYLIKSTIGSQRHSLNWTTLLG